MTRRRRTARITDQRRNPAGEASRMHTRSSRYDWPGSACRIWAGRIPRSPSPDLIFSYIMFASRKRGGGFSAAFEPKVALGRLEIDGLAAPCIRLNVELNALTFGKVAHARRFDGRGMDENVLAAAFRCNEAEAFGSVEEFYCSDRHVFSCQIGLRP